MTAVHRNNGSLRCENQMANVIRTYAKYAEVLVLKLVVSVVTTGL